MKTLIKTKKILSRKPQVSKVYIKPNHRWIDNWLEQTNEVSNKSKTFLVADNNFDDFCFYTNISQVN